MRKQGALVVPAAAGRETGPGLWLRSELVSTWEAGGPRCPRLDEGAVGQGSGTLPEFCSCLRSQVCPGEALKSPSPPCD